MKSFIVITSVFEPTAGVRAFSTLKDHQLIVVGDKGMKADWQCEGVRYLPVDKQEETGVHLNSVLPFNHYSRKMMGYLQAISEGAELIIDTDDDNIPKNNWAFPAFDGMFNVIAPDKGFVNIYQYYSDQDIWPRGLPLSLISRRFDLEPEENKLSCKMGIWQGLADGDPDVDAIYRLTGNKPCVFKDGGPIVLGKNTISPFNSQNTATRKELFPLLYLPATVGFRFTDILRSLVAQPIMWVYDFHLGFTAATVVQQRNPHDYFKDFLSEIPMYQHVENAIETVQSVVSEKGSICDNLFNAYQALEKKNIVSSDEPTILEAWLRELQDLAG